MDERFVNLWKLVGGFVVRMCSVCRLENERRGVMSGFGEVKLYDRVMCLMWVGNCVMRELYCRL